MSFHVTVLTNKKPAERKRMIAELLKEKTVAETALYLGVERKYLYRVMKALAIATPSEAQP